MPVMSDFKTRRPDEYNLWKTALEQLTNSGAGVYLKDLYLSSRAIYYSMGAAFVLCILYIYMMSLFAEYLAWVIVILTQIGLLGATAACFVARTKMNDPEE